MASTEVHILGQTYIVKGDESSEHIKHLADFVDERIKEVYTYSPGIAPLKAAILASLNIADDLFKIRNQYDAISQSMKKAEDKADAILRLID